MSDTVTSALTPANHMHHQSNHKTPINQIDAFMVTASQVVDGGSLISPPLTPMLQAADGTFLASKPAVSQAAPTTTATSTATSMAITSDVPTASTAVSNASSAPIRSSGRSRRPPAFVEGVTTCPICGSLLRASELAEHCEKEKQNLHDHEMTSGTARRLNRIKSSSNYPRKTSKLQVESRKNILARVRLNRHDRISRANHRIKKQVTSAASSNPASTSQAPATASHTSDTISISDASTTTSQALGSTLQSPAVQSTECPVCGVQMTCSVEEMNLHVDSCLSNQPPTADGGGNSGSSEDDSYETYTWCGETRIRATSLLDDTELAASGFNKVKKCDEDVDLVVDEDPADAQFGGAQYTEADVIPCSSDKPAEAKAMSALRKAVISDANGALLENHQEAGPSKWTDDSSLSDGVELKCLICMDRYTHPLVSVQCWHVHCKECWLRTLGAKKLCPQCNLITSPTDLRKIYL